MDLDWNDLRVALAIYEHGALRRAAKVLRVDETTVGRRLAALQSALGVALFVRTPQGMQPTTAGVRLLTTAAPIAAQLTAATQTVAQADQQVVGTVCVTLPESLATHVVLPAWPAMAQRFPHLLLDVRSDAQLRSLAKGEADIAVRMVRPTQSGLLAQRVGSLPFAVFRAVGADRALPLIALAPQAATRAEQALVRAARGGRATSPRLRVNSRMALLAAVQAGLGGGYLPRYLGQSHGLVEDARHPTLGVATWLAMASALRRNARMYAVYRFLAETLGRHVERATAAARRSR